MEIDEMNKFKKKYCQAMRCKLFIVVENNGHEAARFSLSYIHDQIHFALKEGE
jgi:hypothetical protein